MTSPSPSRWVWPVVGGCLSLAACAKPAHRVDDRLRPLELSRPAPAAPVPAELSQRLPAGAQLRLVARGDVDGDGDEDVLLAIDSDTDTSGALPRALWLLRRDADGRLRGGIESQRAILCRRCGGMAGDPLRSIDIAPGTFTLRFEGGSRELWSSTFRFAYVRERDDWVLVGARHAGFDRIEGRGAERVLTAEEIGEVALAEFDASEFPADALE